MAWKNLPESLEGWNLIRYLNSTMPTFNSGYLLLTGGAMSGNITFTTGGVVGPVTGNLTGNVTGNAGTATALQTARAINGVNFDGTAAITVTAAAGTLTGATLAAGVTASSLTSVGTLATLTVTATITGSVSGSSGSTTGNALTATTLQTARAINGVNFDGSAAITVTAAAGTLTGATLAAGVTASSLTSVGTLTALTVDSGAANTSFILNAPATNSASIQYKVAGVTKWGLGRGTLSGANDFELYNYALGANALTISTTNSNATFAGAIVGNLTGNVTGNAGTATALQTARAINGVNFDGTAAITVTAAAGTLTGATLAAGVTASSLTSVGTLATLTVTATITGSVSGSSGSTTGNAATATTLQTARLINGVSFNGSADITVTAAAGTLTGATLAAGVTASSLTSLGTLSAITVSGAATFNTYIDLRGTGSGAAAAVYYATADLAYEASVHFRGTGSAERWTMGKQATTDNFQIVDSVSGRTALVITTNSALATFNWGLTVANGITGTLLTAAQGNVTSLGTLTSLTVNARMTGGIGTDTTAGTLDWNDTTNCRSGSTTTLLTGNATNGPGGTSYYHPFNFEYSAKDGTGQITQLAIGYASPASDIYMRGRYLASWSSWIRLLNSNNFNSYAPTLTGTGASGNWAITATNVTSQANSATITAATAATANTIALRDANGDLTNRYAFSSYVNTSDDVSTGTISNIMAKFGDNYYRSATAAKVVSFLNVPLTDGTGASGSWGINITGTAPAGTLTGGTLAAGVTASSLTSFGALTALTVSGTITQGSSHLKSGTTTNSVSTTATIIQGLTTAGNVVKVFGDNAGVDQFLDEVFCTSGGTTPPPKTTANIIGAPTVRTYSVVAGNLKLAMASGTYNIKTSVVEIS